MSSGLVKFANAKLVESEVKGKAMMDGMEKLVTKTQDTMKDAYPTKKIKK